VSKVQQSAMPPIPTKAVATALFHAWVALLSPVFVVSVVLHAAGFIEGRDREFGVFSWSQRHNFVSMQIMAEFFVLSNDLRLMESMDAVPVRSIHSCIPQLLRRQDMSSTSPIHGSLPDLSSLFPDPVSGGAIGPIGTREGTYILTQ
jgi:hypothetical protein